MDIREIGVVDLSAKRIDYLSEQQRITARNIANADTPGFKASEMRPFSEALKSSNASRPAATHPNHIQSSGPGRTAGTSLNRTAPMSPNGNNVVLEDQMVTAAESMASHSLATSIYQKATGMIRTSVSSR